MRTSEIDILIVPGWTNSGPDHWQSRWQRHLRTARRVEQAEWDRPQRADWVANIIAATESATRPAVLVAHSCGVTAVVHAAPSLSLQRVAGAFLVAPADLDGTDSWPAAHGGFSLVPMQRLPFPSRLIASSNDPHCSIARAQAFAEAWGLGSVDHRRRRPHQHRVWPRSLARGAADLRPLLEEPPPRVPRHPLTPKPFPAAVSPRTSQSSSRPAEASAETSTARRAQR